MNIAVLYRRRSTAPRLLKLRRRVDAKNVSSSVSLDNLYVPEQDSLPYRLQSLANASLSSTAVAALQKKGADVNWISDLCAAAENESAGNMHWVTKKLAGRKTERRFHQFFSRTLPKVSTVPLPLVLSKKRKLVAERPCSDLSKLPSSKVEINISRFPHNPTCCQLKVSSFRALTYRGWRNGLGYCKQSALAPRHHTIESCCLAMKSGRS